MKNVVAVIGCADTKSEEMSYISQRLTSLGMKPFVIDTSLRRNSASLLEADLTVDDLLKHGGYDPTALDRMSKSDAITAVTKSLEIAVAALYENGMLNGGIAAGGLQNSVMASAGLRMLPMGVPKVLVTAMGNSFMPFETFTGRTDLLVMPAIADVAGINCITKTVFDNAIAAVAGMVKNAAERSPKPLEENEKMVAITSVGVTNKGVMLIAERLKALGYTPVFFHGTTGGARAMEDLALAGKFEGILDLNVHDVLVEAIGYYVLNHSAEERLKRLGDLGKPTVFSFSGMDVIDMPRSFYEEGQLPQKEGRRIFKHNADLYHVKVTLDEAVKGAELLAQRLNAYTGPVAVVAPLKGFRDNTQKGEALYAPEIDMAIINTVKSRIKPEIRWVETDCNANDRGFCDAVVNMWLSLQ